MWEDLPMTRSISYYGVLPICNGIAQAVSIKMDTIEAYDYDDSHLPWILSR